MCGIFGIRAPLSAPLRESVRRSLWHRGPDGQQFETVDEWTLFHSRLAIIDLAGGHQPFRTPHSTLVFNGEIYNYRELVSQFSLKTRTSSDTEVISLIYERLGLDVFRHLNGMFALAIYDHRTKQLVLARDRCGKKPLYYGNSPAPVFASEIKAFSAAGIQLVPAPDQVLQHLRMGYVPGPRTVYENVLELEPGTYCLVDSNGKIHPSQRFWSLSSSESSSETVAALGNDGAQTAEKFEHELMAAVERRMLASDLEVGAFLSSGVDSSLVCAMARKINPRIRTFTIASGDNRDESLVAAAIARKLNVAHEILPLDLRQLRNDYVRIVNAYDEPIVDESIIPTYYVSQAAKERVTVVLTGDGGDEIMGGYRRHWLYQNLQRLLLLKVPFEIISSVFGRLSAQSTGRGFLPRLHRILQLPTQYRYWAATTDLFFDAPSPLEREGRDNLGDMGHDLNFTSGLERDFCGLFPKILLKKIDIAAMQHALEPRCPLLDQRVVECAWSLPTKYKIRGRQTKWLLRQLMGKWVGTEFAKLPKRGFEVDVKQLLETTLADLARDLVYAKAPYFAEILDHQHVQKNYLVPGQIEESRRYKGLFGLLNLEIWNRSLKGTT